ncbi:MAG: polymer-forming cytoskeletal protein [Spirochaetales bacterium]|nr:polymer-forming cytoskeletal protein [Spirochaetales bacterium]
MKIKIFLTVFFIAAVVSASAVDIQFSKEKLVEGKTEIGDYIFFGEELEYTGLVDNLYFFGQELNFTGTAESGITAFGKQVTVDGTVKNDMHIGAETVKILGDITGTVFFAGNDVFVGEGAVITGDILAGGSIININGVVNGDVYAAAGKVYINNVVKGTVYTKAKKIIFGENGKIEGNVEYSSDWELSATDRSKVAGSIEYREWDRHYFFDNAAAVENMKIFGIIFAIASFLSFLIAGLLLLVFPASKTLEEERTNRWFLYTGLWGLIPFFIFPVIIVVGALLAVTIPAAFILLLAGLPILLFTQIIGVTLAGQFLFRLFKWKKKSRHLYFLLGMAAAVIISIIPVLSVLGFIFFSALGWGKILEGLFKTEFGNGKQKTAEA